MAKITTPPPAPAPAPEDTTAPELTAAAPAAEVAPESEPLADPPADETAPAVEAQADPQDPGPVQTYRVRWHFMGFQGKDWVEDDLVECTAEEAAPYLGTIHLPGVLTPAY